jgi:hypothetical protein
LFDHENIPNNKYKFTTDGFANIDYINDNVKHLSTENTLVNWIDILNKLPIKENYTNTSEIISEKRPIYPMEDDGSGYTIMRMYHSQKPFHKSLNKIINENIKTLNDIQLI